MSLFLGKNFEIIEEQGVVSTEQAINGYLNKKYRLL